MFVSHENLHILWIDSCHVTHEISCASIRAGDLSRLPMLQYHVSVSFASFYSFSLLIYHICCRLRQEKKKKKENNQRDLRKDKRVLKCHRPGGPGGHGRDTSDMKAWPRPSTSSPGEKKDPFKRSRGAAALSIIHIHSRRHESAQAWRASALPRSAYANGAFAVRSAHVHTMNQMC